MVWGVADVPTWYRNARGSSDPELALRPALLLVAHARPRPGRLRAGLTPIAQPSPRRHPRPVPADFADPGADYRAVRAMMAPFHGHPVPPHITSPRPSWEGSAAPGTTTPAWPDGRARCFHATAARWSRARWTTITSTARSSPTSSRPGCSWRTTGWLPSTRFPPRTTTAWRRIGVWCTAGERDPARLVVTGDSCGGAARVGHAGAAPGTRAWHWPLGSRPSRAGSTSRLPRQAATRRWPRPVPDGGLGAQPGARLHRRRGRARTIRGSHRATPTWPACRRLYLPVGQHDTVYGGVGGDWQRRRRRPGLHVTVESWPGMVHGWQGLASAGVPEALAAFARTRDVLESWGV